MNRKFHGDTTLLQLLGHFPNLVLRLCHRHAVTGDDNDLFCKRHHDSSVRGFNRFHRACHFLRFARGFAEIAEQHVGNRAVHRFCHQLRQQRTRRTHYNARNHHRRVVQHITFKTNRKPRESVVEGNHYRHIRATNRQCHHHAKRQRQCEEQEQRKHAVIRAAGCNAQTHPRHHDKQPRVNALLIVETERTAQLLDTLQLAKRNQRAGERHRANQCAEHRQQLHGRIHFMLLDQFDRCNRRRRTAAHTVVERNHLRHIRHRHFFAGFPCNPTTDCNPNENQ